MKPHYQRIRRVGTRSGSTAIQVGPYRRKRFILTKHIGSSKEPNKIKELIEIAREYIKARSPQLELNFNPQPEEVLFKRGIKVENSVLESAYEYLEGIYKLIGIRPMV